MAREMKDSGIEWIGEIPSDFRICRLKHILEQPLMYGANESGIPFEDSLPRYIRITDITSDGKLKDEGKLSLSKETASDYILDDGDLLFARSGATVGKAFLYKKCYGLSAFAGYLIKAKVKKGISPEYIFYYTQSTAYEEWKRQIFIQSTIQNIGADRYDQLPIPLPEYEKQLKVVSCLEMECSRIDSVIEQTRASIEEYKKLKQALITQAVTRGIRPNRPMKDSGNKWFPYIPKDWKFSRVGLHFNIILGKMLCSNQISDEYSLEPYYCAADVHFDGISNSELKRMWFSPVEKKQYLVNSGDLLVVEGGAGAGGCAITCVTEQSVYIQNSIMIVRAKQNANERYLKYIIESLVRAGYIDVVCNKATIPHFTKEKLANVPFPVSDEQIEIVDYLDEKVSAIDAMILKKDGLISEMGQYKKNLIYEYVTGKKEVPA